MATITHPLALPVPSIHRLVSAVAVELRERRAIREAARRLERDLATYSTPAQIEDLLATFDRYADEDVAPLRAILAENLTAYQRGRLAS